MLKPSAVSNSSTTESLSTALNITRNLKWSWPRVFKVQRRIFLAKGSWEPCSCEFPNESEQDIQQLQDLSEAYAKSSKKTNHANNQHSSVRTYGNKVTLTKVGFGELVAASSTDLEEHHKNCNHKQNKSRKILP